VVIRPVDAVFVPAVIAAKAVYDLIVIVPWDVGSLDDRLTIPIPEADLN
jgi:hypothetical protein